jgi:hypothetical protein
MILQELLNLISDPFRVKWSEWSCGDWNAWRISQYYFIMKAHMYLNENLFILSISNW